MDPIPQAKVLCQGHQLLPEGTVAGDNEVRFRELRRDADCGLQEVRHPLLGLKPGDDTDQRALAQTRRGLFRTRLRGGDHGVRDDGDEVRMHAVALYKAPADRGRDGDHALRPPVDPPAGPPRAPGLPGRLGVLGNNQGYARP
jgi:hypothetical protein